MGSEGPPAVTIHVTGFKKFHGVSENPTETIVSNLNEYMKKKGLPKGLILGSCRVLETAGQGALGPLYQTLQSAIITNNSESQASGRVIWAHFGVNSGATKFAIESHAVNEATFRCPDEMGWKPQVRYIWEVFFFVCYFSGTFFFWLFFLVRSSISLKLYCILQKVPIIPSDGGISQVRETALPVEEITKALVKKGYDVMTSGDAGRFVCNYVYYHSLWFAEQNGIKSLFVHVPLFLAINEDTQMQFAASLLEVLCSLYL
uniref:Pyrrolidone-carboxylate peptidase n=1 Tax=Rhizophora mucronata TaxID=61149 RepID=A0A2P2LRU0_RHIMU